MRIIVAHPGRQHSFRLASALKKNGDLLYYCTTIYNKDSSILMKLVKKTLSRDNLKRANCRVNNDLEDSDVVQFCEFRGMLEALVSRIDKSHKVYRWLQRINSDVFGVKVAKLAIKEKADAVIMYDTNSLAGFKYLKKHAPNIIRIQDVSIVPRPYMKDIYCSEVEKSGNLDLKKDNEYLWNSYVIDRLQAEIDETHYFLAASQFVKCGLMKCGIREEQIKIVPYGANVSSEIDRSEKEYANVLEFLFVGQVNYRKGITYLIDSMTAFAETANLTITGAYNPNDWFVKKAKKQRNIQLTGLVTLDKMKAIYERSDVFVLPSFAEGMAQVGIEAMACGLPIICTFNSGIADLVEDGVNGFIIEAGNLEQLVEKMRWFTTHKKEIIAMGTAAKETARAYTWSAYEGNVIRAIDEIFEEVRQS